MLHQAGFGYGEFGVSGVCTHFFQFNLNGRRLYSLVCTSLHLDQSSVMCVLALLGARVCVDRTD